MALTIGTGPFGKQPVGRFDVEPPLRPLLFWEPFLKRFRVVAGGETIVDSRKVIALHETGQMMRLCVPWSDVRRDLLAEGHSSGGGRTGSLRSWSAVAGGPSIARSFEAPPATAAPIKDLVVFDLDKIDAWYLEDNLGYAHPRDPYHRVDVLRGSQHVTIRTGKTRVAESAAPALLFETSMGPRFYLPPDAVRMDVLEKSETVSQCPYKGDGQHWHVVTDGQRIPDAAWSLTTPMGDALTIPRWFSFYPEKLEVEVDGELLRA